MNKDVIVAFIACIVLGISLFITKLQSANLEQRLDKLEQRVEFESKIIENLRTYISPKY